MAWLDQRGIAFQWIDYRDHPVADDVLQACVAKVGWPGLVNRSGTTWRGLPVADRSPASDTHWLALVRRHPTLVRRPLVVGEDGFLISGFSAERYEATFAHRSVAEHPLP